jgi:large subunit ribosomal protein L21
MAETTTAKPIRQAQGKPKAAKPATAPKSGKKAVISTGGHQYLVYEGEELEIDLLDPVQQATAFEALLVIDGDTVSVGAPTVSGVKVTAEILEQSVKGEKVVAIRYKPKKRVRKVRGHRQRHARIKITKIA